MRSLKLIPGILLSLYLVSLLLAADPKPPPTTSGVFNVRDYGAVGNGATDDTAAIQACIDASIGAPGGEREADHARLGTRGARGPIYLPAGEYRISKPLRIYSAQYVQFHGDGGSSRLTPVGKLDSVLDINGCAYSTFRDFLIQGNGKDESVTDAICCYYDPKTALRSATRIVFERIIIHGTRCVTAMRIGKPGSGLQCDQIAYRDLTITGAWKAGEKTWYQHGLHIGDGLFANNLIHSAYNFTSSFWAHGVTVAASNFAMFGGAFGQNGTDLNAGTLSYFTVQGIRCESSNRLFESIVPNSNIALYNLSDIIWAANAIASDGEFIRMQANGSLSVTNLHVVNGGSTAKLSAKPTLSSTVQLSGIAAQNSLNQFLDLSPKATVIVEGFYQYDDKVGQVEAAEGFLTSGPVRWLGAGGGALLWNQGEIYSLNNKGRKTRLTRPQR